MFSQRLQDAINEQINAELASAYLYLSMSAHFEYRNLPGFAHWMRLQYEEETLHALKFLDFLNDRGARVLLKPIAGPTTDFASPLEVFEKTLAHEQKVTGLINKLYQLAVNENDYPSQVLLQWYITEQVEEEKNATTAVEQLKLVGDSAIGLLLLDREMGARQAGAEAEAAA